MGDPTKTAPLHTERTTEEEWSEIVLCMGMLADRLDALVFTGPAMFVYVKYVLGY